MGRSEPFRFLVRLTNRLAIPDHRKGIARNSRLPETGIPIVRQSPNAIACSETNGECQSLLLTGQIGCFCEPNKPTFARCIGSVSVLIDSDPFTGAPLIQ